MKTILLSFFIFIGLILSGCGGSGAPEPAATADAAVMQVVDSLNANNAAGPWNMMPESYQQDLNGLMHGFAGKMDAGLWNSGTGTLKKLEEVLRTKKDLLLASPMLKSAPMQQDLSANYDQLVAILGTLTDSKLMSLEELKTADMGTLLSSTGSRLMEQASEVNISNSSPKPMGMNSMLKMPGKILETKAELVSEDGDTAVVRITTEGEKPQEVPFVRVEGKWIPQDMADNFPKSIQDGKKALEKFRISPQMKSQAMMGLNMVNGMLDQIQAANTQEELQGVLGGMMGMMGGRR